MTDRHRAALLLLGPSVLLMAGTAALPLGYELWVSLTSAQPGDPGDFVGLANYAYLLRSQIFWSAVGHTFQFAVGGTLLKACLGLATALVLIRPFPGRPVLAAALFLPFVFPVSVSCVAWYYLFSNVHGGLDVGLMQLGLIDHPLNWLNPGKGPMLALILVAGWHGAALFALLILAGLRATPRELLEQAAVEGAGTLDQWLRIRLPLLRPQLALATALSLLGTFGDYAAVHLITRGGPIGQTTILSTLALESALRDGDLGVAAAVSILALPVYGFGLLLAVRELR